ncbi:hypothetical protein I316_06754 [Kwoniella heveanensis BCC8398]|uniref:Uncharacterized protein n=1 Tax=Kwoniella heveanensis BCC8398 TaxID=1296120 RepID=A0A1B9GKU1_9TREE|nr:hypothetical protein I316_06754 [Kwoniella heveanensis BCC8398]
MLSSDHIAREASLGAAPGCGFLLASQTTSTLQSRGINYTDGKLSVQTNRAAPSRDEYIASTQAAFERGGKMMKAHANAFSFGKGDASKNEKNESSSGSGSGQAQVKGASSVEVTPDRKGFRRTKKLA